MAWFIGQGSAVALQAGGLHVDPTLAAARDPFRAGGRPGQWPSIMTGLMHTLDLLVTVLTAIGRGLLGEERWAEFQAAIDVAREKVSHRCPDRSGSAAVDDLSDAADEAARATRTWKDRLPSAGHWSWTSPSRPWRAFKVFLSSAPLVERFSRPQSRGCQSGGPAGAAAEIFTLLGSSRQFGELMKQYNPILQAFADVIGAILGLLIPLAELHHSGPVLQQLAPAWPYWVRSW